MARTVEGDPASPLNKWPLLLNEESIKPIFSCCLGCKQEGKWTAWLDWFGREKEGSLFYNGIFYFRFMLPFWIGVGIRWAGGNPTRREYLQTGIGWKGNGRFAILLRIQSDRSAAEGTSGPNYGQAEGFNCGTK